MICKFAHCVVVAAAIAAAAPAAAAELATAPLAPNEVLLEIVSTGEAHNRADKVTIQALVSARAATPVEARRQLDARVDRVQAAALNAGAGAADITVEHPQRLGFMGNEALAATVELPQAQALPETAQIEIRIRDPNRYAALRDALEAAGAATVTRPTFALSNVGPAREQAKGDALLKGRAEAEAYARSLGMRVVRIARVSEHVAGDMTSPEMVENMMKSLNGGESSDGDVKTMVNVEMDFVLGPAR